MQSVPRFLGVLVVGAIAILLLVWVTQRRLIYLPSQAVPDPTALPIEIDEVTYITEDGLDLSGWFVPSTTGRSGGTVVLFNGNAGNRAGRLPLARAVAEAGHSVFMVDYRGYGGNPGRPSEEGLALDARAAHAYLMTRSDVDPERLIYFGESLGAAVALGLARDEAPAALVLRSPFTSLSDVGSVHYPFLPVALLLWDRYSNLQTIGDIDVPVLIVAGSEDSIVPVEQSQMLFEVASGPKRLVIIESADHNDLALASGEQLIEEVVAFIADSLPGDNG